MEYFLQFRKYGAYQNGRYLPDYIVPNVENFIITEYNFKSLNLEETKTTE
jgi:hypothetical protein